MARTPIRSRAAIRGHPLHPVLIHLPIAALLMLAGSDLGYLITRDPFWARAGLWLAGIGTVLGATSGVAGAVDLTAVARIRRLVTAWAHALLAVMLLSLASLNFLLRLNDPVAYLLPWGLYLSVLSTILIQITGLLGGQLVYEYAVGVDFEHAANRDVKP